VKAVRRFGYRLGADLQSPDRPSTEPPRFIVRVERKESGFAD
jgi:hypothetical protein